MALLLAPADKGMQNYGTGFLCWSVTAVAPTVSSADTDLSLWLFLLLLCAFLLLHHFQQAKLPVHAPGRRR